MRHLVLPLLRANFDNRIEETLAERASGLAQDIKLLYALIEGEVSSAAKHRFGSRAWLRTVKLSMAAMPVALQWRFAETLFKPVLGYNLGRSKSMVLGAFLSGEAEGIELPGGIRLRAKAGGVLLDRG